jgi:hypothetical protein
LNWMERDVRDVRKSFEFIAHMARISTESLKFVEWQYQKATLRFDIHNTRELNFIHKLCESLNQPSKTAQLNPTIQKPLNLQNSNSQRISPARFVSSL